MAVALVGAPASKSDYQRRDQAVWSGPQGCPRSLSDDVQAAHTRLSESLSASATAA